MRPAREKRGQFVIIAVLLAAIMIISVGTLMNSALTYYKHEPWEEYSTLIGDIEINTRRLVELTLVNCTNDAVQDSSGASGILAANLQKWQDNLTDIYPNSGIRLTRLSSNLIDQGSNPEATASFNLDLKTVGLTGYTFSTNVYLSLTLSIKSINSTYHEINATVLSESGAVSGLKNSFRINYDKAATSVRPFPSSSGILIYIIPYNGTLPVTIEVWDQRGIRAFASV